MVGEGKVFQAGAVDTARLSFSLLSLQGFAHCRHSKTLNKQMGDGIACVKFESQVGIGPLEELEEFGLAEF